MPRINICVDQCSSVVKKSGRYIGLATFWNAPFPHADFRPLIQTNLGKAIQSGYDNSIEFQELYHAVAAYQDDQAIAMLKQPFTQVKDEVLRTYHLEYVFIALEKLKTPMYDSLLWSLWENENILDADIFRYLKEKDPERAYQQTIRSLEKPAGNQIHLFSSRLGDFEGQHQLSEAMFEFARSKD